MIPVDCSACGVRIYVPEALAGREGLCFGCGAAVTAPSTAGAAAAKPATLSFQEGDKVAGRYEIGERIGKGGMGMVFKAYDTLVDEAIALKFMNPKMLRTQRGQRLFIQEAQVARRLRHDNIVAVHDVGTTPEGILYLTMEYVQGQSLRAYLRQHRASRKLVSVRLAVALMIQILEALSHAHRTVVHRDIKPENIMLTPGEHVKVLDFGLAKAVDEGEVELRPRHRAKRVVGTFGYAAPEQKQHHKVDLRADIYSAGLVLYELLTLRTPLDAFTETANVRDDVAPSLLSVLSKALREERDNRWQTADEFRASLMKAYEESYRQAPKPAVQAHSSSGAQASTDGMALMEGGSFLMGNDEVPAEAPEFEAELESFYIDIYPVTVRQYTLFLEQTGRPPPKFWGNSEFSGADQPVIGVSWGDANAYAAWAGKQLPTEAQWEFAARGKQNRVYPWGNSEPTPMRANYGDFLNMPSIVAMHDEGATPDGVYDMAGNVYEWTLDAFVPYSGAKRKEMQGHHTPRRAVRGGSWHSPPTELRCAFRKGLFPESQLTTVGFRCIVPVT